MGTTWDASCWSTGSTVTLEGLNRVLVAAEREVARRRSEPQFALFGADLLSSGAFAPARSRLEAVSRISSLTGSPPEELGPGSKERKSVLVNLAAGLGVDLDTSAPKPELGGTIAQALSVDWDEACWSAGHTITLIGLNRLLQGGEARLAGTQPSRGLFMSPRHEAAALLGGSCPVPARRVGRQEVRRPNARC